jgi:hypothetical protein
MPLLLERITDQTGYHVEYAFWCPGCKINHSYVVQRKDPKDVGPVWQWNGSLEKPTFSPSLLVWGSRPEQRCHLFVTDGKIQFLGDCAHDLKNQTVPLLDYDTLS